MDEVFSLKFLKHQHTGCTKVKVSLSLNWVSTKRIFPEFGVMKKLDLNVSIVIT